MKRFIVHEDGSTSLVDWTQEEIDAFNAALAADLPKRKERRKKKIKRYGEMLVDPYREKIEQAQTMLSFLTNKRASGTALTADELTTETNCKTKLQKWYDFKTRVQELMQAVDDGLVVDIQNGSIDGVGSWPGLT